MTSQEARRICGPVPLNVQKAPRVRRSDCRKSLAEFAPAGAKKMEIIFSGGVYVGENTARLANVRRVDRKSTRLNSSHRSLSRMPSSA